MPDNDRDRFADRGNERLILACVLQHAPLLVEAAVKVSEADFLTEHHRALYSVLNSLFSQGVETFDLMAVVNEAESKGVLRLVGGSDYISALFVSEVDRRNFGIYLDKVLDASIKYKLYRAAEQIQEVVVSNLGTAEGRAPAKELLAQAESRVVGVSVEACRAEGGINICDGLTDYVMALGTDPKDIRGIRTGLPVVDYHINGLIPGSLTVISGRQKAGKSALMTNIASHVAFDEKTPILYIDTEMPTRDVITRIVAHRSGVPERDISNGTFIRSPRFCEQVRRACDEIKNRVFIHEYMPGFTVDGVLSVIRKYHATDGIGVFFFDYIKRPSEADVALNESQLLGNITTALKDIAGRLDIPGVAGAQLKRGDAASPRSKHYDTDVADSDKIGRYCDNLLALAPKTQKEQEEDGPSCGTHRLQVLLARRGKPSFHGVDLHFTFPTLSLRQAEHQSGGLSQFSVGGPPGW